jgi:hypothetical protein
MSKIVQAVNAMISNPHLISNVVGGRSEIFFLYKDRYAWSIKKDGAEHLLWFYPSAEISDLLERDANEYWEGVDLVTYKTADLGTREAKASFAELYTLLKEREFGVNDVLDDIISDSDPF